MKRMFTTAFLSLLSLTPLFIKPSYASYNMEEEKNSSVGIRCLRLDDTYTFPFKTYQDGPLISLYSTYNDSKAKTSSLVFFDPLEIVRGNNNIQSKMIKTILAPKGDTFYSDDITVKNNLIIAKTYNKKTQNVFSHIIDFESGKPQEDATRLNMNCQQLLKMRKVFPRKYDTSSISFLNYKDDKREAVKVKTISAPKGDVFYMDDIVIKNGLVFAKTYNKEKETILLNIIDYETDKPKIDPILIGTRQREVARSNIRLVKNSIVIEAFYPLFTCSGREIRAFLFSIDISKLMPVDR